MKQKKGDEVIFDENDREQFLLGFHKRKQQKKIEYLTKKALRDKKNRVLEKMARKRNLIRRERELGLLEPEGARSTVTSQHDVQDKFSKDMFGTDQVTVTVEYEGDDPDASQEEEKQQQEQQEQQEQPEVDDETLLNNDESKPDEKEQELDEEEKAVLESVTLSEKEMRKIREQAGSKKSKKGKKSRRRKHH